MVVQKNEGLDYEEPVKISEGIYWVGFLDKEYNLNCNPYLIIEENEGVVIDGGSRTDFSTVMMKILQTGINPSHIEELIYQHHDPDLCGSIPDFEEIIDNNDLSIISHTDNNYYIRYYGGSLKRKCIEKDINFDWNFSTGRKLQFIVTPYVHTPGNFITFDKKTKTLFTSDLFGSYYRNANFKLYLELKSECFNCTSFDNCYYNKSNCSISKILNFHQDIIPSKKALDYTLNKIVNLEIETIAPQHGSIIVGKKKIDHIINRLKEMNQIGIDQFV